MLSKNLASLRKNKHLSQDTLSQIVGVSRSTYAGYEKGTSEPIAGILTKLADYFEISVDDLIRGDVDLPMFRQTRQIARLLDSGIRVLPITVDNHQRENIQYVPESAIAGYLSEHNHPEYIEKLPHFQLPKLNNGTYRAFDIQGNSMPPIHNGYILIGRFVELEQHLKSGNRYILVIKDKGIVFKKIVRDGGKSTRQNGHKLILVSDNPEFLPYSVELADILEAWEMVAFIGFPDIYKENTYLINERLQMIEQRLESLKK